jgi:DNA-directed RNA polymerase subunit RPC12/RpoP
MFRMRAERSLRLPLQVGTSALLSLARGSALAVPGIILLTIAIVIILWLPDMGDASGYLFAIIATPGGAISLFAYKHLKRAHTERPSDLIVTPEAFSINGGPYGGLRVTWPDLIRVAVEKQLMPTNKDDTDDSDQCSMTIYFDNDRHIRLASAERAGEQQSLRELGETLEAAAHPATEATSSVPAVDVFSCAGCSAAIAPADAATVTCPYCKAVVPVPEPVRSQIRDADALQHKPDVAIGKLLDQPGATLVGAMYIVASAFMLVAWPLAIVLMVMEFRAGTLSWIHVGELVGFVAACILGFYALIRTRLVDRQALRLLAVEFAAVEPVKPGDPYRCQHCLAPLPDAGDARVIVRCLYCSTDNVLGLHLGRQAKVAREENRSLASALARRRVEHRRWRGVTFVALGLLVVSWFALRYGARLH